MVAGNWKMNKNLQEGLALASELKAAVKDPKCAVVIGTPFIHLASVAELLKGSPIKVAAENCADHEKGAYTGEVQSTLSSVIPNAVSTTLKATRCWQRKYVWLWLTV